MPVNITGGRPVPVTTAPLAISLAAEAPIENDATNEMRFRVSLQDVTPPAFTIASVTTVNGSPTISAANLRSLRKGDAVTNANITGTVVSVNTTPTPNTAVISANASAGGSATLNVTPATVDFALYDLKVGHRINATDSNMGVMIEIHKFTGANSNDNNADGKDDVAASSDTLVQSFSFTHNLDSYLSNVRVPRA